MKIFFSGCSSIRSLVENGRTEMTLDQSAFHDWTKPVFQFRSWSSPP